MKVVNTFIFSKGGRGGGCFPKEAEDFFLKKSNGMKALPSRWDFFVTFLQSSVNPQNYELAPQIPEIITSVPQLPENK